MARGATSGTYNFAPPVSDLYLEAFSRCGIRGTAITRRHMIEATRSINLEFVDWSNRGVNLWERKGPITASLVAGQPTYLVTQQSVAILDVWYSIANGLGSGVNNDRIMLPISRDQYAMIPNKLQQGIPTVYWYDKLTIPQITIWETPLVGQVGPTYNLQYYYLSQMQDAAPYSGQIPDVPYRALNALVAGLAAKLAEKFAPERLQEKMTLAERAWNIFIGNDQENAGTYIMPTVSSYWPR